MKVNKKSYGLFLETIPDAAILVDTDGEINLANIQAEGLFGYSHGDLAGMSVNILVPQLLRHKHEQLVSHYLVDPKPRPMHSNLEFFGLHSSGSIIPLDIMLKPLEIEGEQYVLGVVRDVSERLQKLEEINTIINTSLDGFWLVDKLGHFIRVNDAYCNMIGYSREQLLGMSISDVEARETPSQTAWRIQQISKQGSDRFETQHLRKNGTVIDIEVSVNYLSDKDGGRFFVFLRDISERKQAFSDMDQFNRLILASSSIGFLGYEVETGQCVIANEAAAKMVGARREDLLAQNFRTIASWEASGLLEAAHSAIETGKEQNFGTNVMTTFGREIYLQGTFNIFIKDGRTHLLLSCLDITEKEKAHIELAQAYEATVDGWARALELRDPETEGHTQRVARLTTQLARAMSIDEREIVHIHRGALLHDIGKMAIPDKILQKPGRLSEEDWVEMRRHPEYAVEMLKSISYLQPAMDIPKYHHEKWDGSGYPHGLRGEQIPLSARVFAVIDVWDALRSKRPYRNSWSRDKALIHIRNQAGVHFDPRVVNVFLNQLTTGLLKQS